jgi:hypothetical protein
MANFIRLKQIESGSYLNTSAAIGADFSQSVISIIVGEVQAVLPDGVVSSSAQIYITGTIGYNDIATDIEVAVVSSSISTSLSLISSSIASVTGDFSSSVSTSLNLLSSSLNAFTSSIGLTIKQKLNTENVVTSSRQLDGSVINNLTIGTTGDNYSLIVSGALAVVDADITISGSQYNVGGQIWVNGQTGSAGNPPAQPYDNVGNAQADIIDQGEW